MHIIYFSTFWLSVNEAGASGVLCRRASEPTLAGILEGGVGVVVDASETASQRARVIEGLKTGSIWMDEVKLKVEGERSGWTTVHGGNKPPLYCLDWRRTCFVCSKTGIFLVLF